MSLSLLLTVLLLAQAAPDPSKFVNLETSPRELYVSCSLALTKNRLLEDRVEGRFKPQAPGTCAALSVLAMKISAEEARASNMKFCAVESVEFAANTLDALALAYVSYFEQNSARLGNVSGMAVMMKAFVDKWPCNK